VQLLRDLPERFKNHFRKKELKSGFYF